MRRKTATQLILVGIVLGIIGSSTAFALQIVPLGCTIATTASVLCFMALWVSDFSFTPTRTRRNLARARALRFRTDDVPVVWRAHPSNAQWRPESPTQATQATQTAHSAAQ